MQIAYPLFLLRQYRKRVNPDVSTFIINLQPYEFLITPQDENGVTVISSWNSSVLKYIELSETDMVREVERIVF